MLTTIVNGLEQQESKKMELEAVHVRGNKWVVRPAGQLGTCGFYPAPWSAIWVSASSAKDALRKTSRKN